MDATFEISNWDETTVIEWDGGKLTRAGVTKTYDGDLVGDATLEYLLAYRPDGTAAFVGIESIAASAGEREGTLVLRQVGIFADGAAKADVTVVGGTGGFEACSGEGRLEADPAGRLSLELQGA